MSFILDEKGTFGDILFLKAEEWKKYNTQEVLGVKVYAVSLVNFEKFNVKIADIGLEFFENIKFKSLITFDFLEVRFYMIEGKRLFSFYARDVEVLKEF